jgi:hypothetical protein
LYFTANVSRFVSLAATHIACDVNVGKKIHLDALHAVAFAAFASTALNIE